MRAVINRGGEQGAQHSQALARHVHARAGVEGGDAGDARRRQRSADGGDGGPNPVLYIDDRWLYAESGEVPAEPFTVPIGEAAVRRSGSDVTLIGISWMASECVRPRGILEREGIDAEVIDLRSLKPWDKAEGGGERVAHRTSRGGRRGMAHGGGVGGDCRGGGRARFRRFACTCCARDAARRARAREPRRRTGVLSGRRADRRRRAGVARAGPTREASGGVKRLLDIRSPRLRLAAARCRCWRGSRWRCGSKIAARRGFAAYAWGAEAANFAC